MQPFIFKFDRKKVLYAASKGLYNLVSFKELELYRFYIMPAERCDDACVYCRKKNVQTEDLFSSKRYVEKLILDIKGLKIKEVLLYGGGEPFFYKDNMFYFLEELRGVDTFVKIITNGNNLDDSDIKEIVKNGLVSSLALNLNTDSADLARNIYLNGERHNHTLNLLESLSKYKKVYNKNFPLVDILFVLFNMNYNKIAKIISILKRFDLNSFHIQPLRVVSKQQSRLRLSEEQVNEFKQALSSLDRDMRNAGIKANIGDFKIHENLIHDSGELKCVVPNKTLSGKARLGCYMPLTTFFIKAEGLIPKCGYLEEVYYDSNYFSIPSLKDFIHSEEFTNFIEKFINSDNLSFCKNCHIGLLHEIEEIKTYFQQLNEKDMPYKPSRVT